MFPHFFKQRQSLRWLLPVLLAAIALRVLFIWKYGLMPYDSVIYADIAKTWLNHQVFGFGNVATEPTLIRLPGYPAFLAVIFALFGQDHFFPIYIAQVLLDLGTCVAVAMLAQELVGERAAKIAFVMAALCPFTANYVAYALTETLAIFSTAVAFLFFVRALRNNRTRDLVLCGIVVSYGILLRPDDGIVLAALLAYLLWQALRERQLQFLRSAVVLGVVSVLPLIPWTIRNWRTFHVFQPLVSRYAAAPGEFVPLGFNRWSKTWMVDYTSVEEIFWKVSSDVTGETVDTGQLPTRAFDLPGEEDKVEELFADYNLALILTPEMDTRFAELARERIRARPFRYYVSLPLMRIADMWFRPRTEALPIERRWWEFDDTREGVFALCYSGLDLLLVVLGVWGMLRFRNVAGWGALVGFIVLRSVFLGTLENPEPRYTLECFPVIFAFAAARLAGWRGRRTVFHAEVGPEVL